ncbi:ATP-binding protein [Bartonella sp. TT119HLJHH]|uniref:ATP-binding protein n=1 Tax=Bartonella sp. TT119HLJHH TaxID=3243579 RepID=UPI0035CEBB36
MLVNLNAIIRDLSSETNIVTVLKESIVNSIQAHATQIDILFQLHGNVDLWGNQPVFSISVFDNGDGFTKENIKSFSTYKSDYKIREGCKGVGRITYLKIFEEVKIVSFSKDEHNAQISLNFTPQFTQDSFKKENGQKYKWWNTHLYFERPYKQNVLDINLVHNEIYYHLLPLLFLKKDENIRINFYVHNVENLEDVNNLRDVKNLEDVESLKKKTINTQDLPYLENKTLKIGPLNIPFTLSYYFEENKNSNTKIEAYYCANNRTVMPFSKFMNINPINNVMMIFLLESSVLDEYVNDERNDFEINKKDPDLETRLTWENINQKLEIILDEIINIRFPEIKEKKSTLLKKIAEEYPYLVDFLDTKDVIGGVFKEDSFIENAEKKYSKRKLAFRKTLHEGKGKPKENLQKAQKFASLELTQYIQFRDDILNQFSKLLTPKTLEKDIHNLFIHQGKTADKLSPLPLKENNLWIIDDKFMSYNYLQSEKTIQEFLSNVDSLSINSGRKKTELCSRPDIAIYFDSEEKKRVVLIELKKPTADYKNSGVAQLSNYARVLKTYGVNEIYLYLIAEIDDDFAYTLLDTNHFIEVFSQEGKCYQGSLSMGNAFVQVISPNAVIGNAKARNRTFMDIIKKDLLHHRSKQASQVFCSSIL